MLFHSYNMFAGGEILINVIECEWVFLIPLEEEVMLGRRLSSNMPLMATQYFAGSNSKEKLTIGSQKLDNNIFSNLWVFF